MMQSWKQLKVLNYQPQIVWSLRDDLRKLGIITDDDEYIKNFYHPRSFLGPFTQYIHDRSRKIRHFLPMHDHLAPLPSYDPEFNGLLDPQTKFEELMIDRALDLLSHGKKVNVFWSGGLDSMTIALTMIYCASNKDQVHIFGTHDSVVESGPMFDYFIKNSGARVTITPRLHRNLLFPNTKIVQNRPYQPLDVDMDNDVFVDGHTADQLYGKQQIFSPQWRVDLLDKHWEDAVLEIHGDEEGRKVIEFTKPALTSTNFPIHSYREFLWWYKMNFSMHQQVYASEAVTTLPIYKANRFFDWEPLVQWAMVNGPGIIEQLPDKMPQRLWMYRLTKNAEYCFLKKRYRSTGTTFYNKTIFTDHNYNQIFEYQIRKAAASI